MKFNNPTVKSTNTAIVKDENNGVQRKGRVQIDLTNPVSPSSPYNVQAVETALTPDLVVHNETAS